MPPSTFPPQPLQVYIDYRSTLLITDSKQLSHTDNFGFIHHFIISSKNHPSPTYIQFQYYQSSSQKFSLTPLKLPVIVQKLHNLLHIDRVDSADKGGVTAIDYSSTVCLGLYLSIDHWALSRLYRRTLSGRYRLDWPSLFSESFSLFTSLRIYPFTRNIHLLLRNKRVCHLYLASLYSRDTSPVSQS